MKRTLLVPILLIFTSYTLYGTTSIASKVAKADAQRMYQIIDNQKIATFVTPSFLEKGLDAQEVQKWKDLVAAANQTPTNDPALMNALSDFPALLTFITSSITSLHNNYQQMSRDEFNQLAQNFKQKQALAQRHEDSARKVLMESMHADWDRNKPAFKASKALESKEFKKDYETFLDAYREQMKRGPVSLSNLKFILQTKGIVSLPTNLRALKPNEKFPLSNALGDLLLKLENYAYLLENHRYTTTHKSEKLAAARQAAQGIDALVRELGVTPQWQMNLTQTTNKPAAIVLAQAGAYGDILGQLYRETFNRAHEIKF